MNNSNLKTNKLTESELGTKLDELRAASLAWENGAYKTSNEQLYDILGKCFDLLCALKGKNEQIKLLNKVLKERGVGFKSGTALATKVVRFVFDGCSKERSYTYARVLNVASEEKAEKVSLRQFIVSKGGIEAVRKASKNGALSAADKKNAAIEHADRYYAEAEAMVSDLYCDAAELQPHAETGIGFSVALLRRNANNSLSIVFGTNNESLVKQVLAEAGKKSQEIEQQQATKAQEAQQRKSRRQATKKAVESAGSTKQRASRGKTVKVAKASLKKGARNIAVQQAA